MKKYLILFISLILIFSLCGCKEESNKQPQVNNDNTQTQGFLVPNDTRPRVTIIYGEEKKEEEDDKSKDLFDLDLSEIDKEDFDFSIFEENEFEKTEVENLVTYTKGDNVIIISTESDKTYYSFTSDGNIKIKVFDNVILGTTTHDELSEDKVLKDLEEYTFEDEQGIVYKFNEDNVLISITF